MRVFLLFRFLLMIGFSFDSFIKVYGELWVDCYWVFLIYSTLFRFCIIISC